MLRGAVGPALPPALLVGAVASAAFGAARRVRAQLRAGQSWRDVLQTVLGGWAARAIVGAAARFEGSRAWLQQRLRTQPKAFRVLLFFCTVTSSGSVGVAIFLVEKKLWWVVDAVRDLGGLYARAADPVPRADLLVRCALVFSAPLLIYAALLLEQDSYDAAHDADLAAATDRIRRRPALGGNPWAQ